MTATGTYGRFTRKENGLIYIYKADHLAIDALTALEFIDIIHKLDDSGAARIIVMQGSGVEYTFSAQKILLTNNVLAGLAYVVQTNTKSLYFLYAVVARYEWFFVHTVYPLLNPPPEGGGSHLPSLWEGIKGRALAPPVLNSGPANIPEFVIS